MTMTDNPAGSAIDPVCGMRVDPATTPHQSRHEGVTYSFCGPGCERAFKKAPQLFLAGDAASAG